ncbi:succinic semialdehyde dehydrogenase [Natronobacterium gregoryi]|uniref:NAD-dependent aldehyde dehydrogenase n=2 Tax=Natronobacterium gregoryi TaxID=44930 RepID=L0ACS0_NATGS|nr:succinic semialdehyde dehydrogenase [Natronobacterium gregoryi]AFZ71693.1 NAD-dependent aldehyde dehydrogenase [Natronobacterium gregoryi SP2]ELY72736.1 succinic semialdehyde dehydrogenase [Natronobacterium gregoryi SP2]PLK20260.1 succinate-semialdehyde dehydrogenase (NADP(+)) [Natronobacterium gregoryi SP2]SFJ25530.1 succinate-semialdehyde dehydrogenase / glutarate-semialdehyde dehydrogenase [Natronobacterium gregoryi]
MGQTSGPQIFAETTLAARRLERLSARIEAPGERSSLEVRTPVTDEAIGSVPACTANDVSAAVERARSAQSGWERATIDERAAILERFGDLVLDRREELLDLVQLETGKSRQHAVEEVLDVPLTCSYYAANGVSVLADADRSSAVPLAADATVTYDPVGVVGVISPWNYPLTLAMTDAVPALLAGNAVVCKPDERTPFIALALAELLAEAGLPAGLFQVVTGEGETVGPALVDEVDYVTFTGGTETGRTVAKQAGRNLIGCSLELGGKNPMLVLDDADIETAARGAVKGAFTNAGQLCLAPERIYVDEHRYDEFLDAFVGATRRLELGLEFEYGPAVGSLIDDDHLESVREFVDDAVENGASLLSGGRSRPDVGPFCYEPTILTDVDPDSRVACEETFGPVVSVHAVSSVDEAIERANDSEYGLNASVWTADRKRGRAVAREIDCGTVCVNDPYTVGWAAIDAPMGGFGDSGLGRRHGPEGLKRYVDVRTIATSRIGPMDAPPGISPRWFARFMFGLTAVQRRLARWLP